MAKHRSSRSPAGVSTNRQIIGRVTEEAAEITDIIPFNEFGDLADLDFYQSSAFDREAQVIHAPELDDLHDTDDQLPQRLAVPSEFRRDPRDERRSSRAYRDSYTDVSDGMAATDIIAIAGRGGAHRKQEGPQLARGVPVKGRLMVAAMAVGATAAGAYSMANSSEEAPATVLAADQSVHRRRRDHRLDGRHAGRDRRARRPPRRCTPRRSPRPPRSRRSAPNARPVCSARCS